VSDKEQPAQRNPPADPQPEPELPVGESEWVERGGQQDSETRQR
jgi:hypothetical protein